MIYINTLIFIAIDWNNWKILSTTKNFDYQFAFTGKMNGLHPNMLEQISVGRRAAATAIMMRQRIIWKQLMDKYILISMLERNSIFLEEHQK